MKAAFDLGRDQWPAVRSLTFEAFQSFVDDGAVEPDALAERGGRLYLAAAAAGGDDDAVRLFDSKLLSEPAALAVPAASRRRTCSMRFGSSCAPSCWLVRRPS